MHTKKMLILLSLLVIFSAGTLPAAEAPANESASSENQRRQNQENKQENFKVSVKVDLVITDVTVLGRGLTKLNADDFIIYDNKVSQEVSFFSYDQLPIAVAVLIDRSGSVIPYFPMLQIAALLSLKDLKTEDQVALFSFADGCSKLSDLTRDRLSTAQKITKIQAEAYGRTNIFGALYDTARYLRKKAPDRRRAIILISDNNNTTGEGNIKKAREEMLETSTTLYSIRTPWKYPMVSGVMPYNIKESNNQVKEIVEKTGGELLEVNSSTSIQAALNRAITNIRYRYSLGFSPSDRGETGSFHTLEVRLREKDRCPECRLLTRVGYYAGVQPTVAPASDVQPATQESSEEVEQLLIHRSILTAGTTELDLPDIQFKAVTVEQIMSMGQQKYRVNLLINPSDIEFEAARGEHLYNLQIAVFYADVKGNILGAVWKKTYGHLSERNYNFVMENGFPYETLVPQKVENQIYKVVVYDERSNRIGSKLVKLTEDEETAEKAR